MNRRHFFKILGYAAVGMTVAKATTANAVLIDPTQSYLREDGLVSQSTGYLLVSHSHTLLVPIELLLNPPPQGAELHTSVILAHRHRVILSQSQLIAISNGQVVEVMDSTTHEHKFHLHLQGGTKNLD